MSITCKAWPTVTRSLPLRGVLRTPKPSPHQVGGLPSASVQQRTGACRRYVRRWQPRALRAGSRPAPGGIKRAAPDSRHASSRRVSLTGMSVARVEGGRSVSQSSSSRGVMVELELPPQTRKKLTRCEC